MVGRRVSTKAATVAVVVVGNAVHADDRPLPDGGML